MSKIRIISPCYLKTGELDDDGNEIMEHVQPIIPAEYRPVVAGTENGQPIYKRDKDGDIIYDYIPPKMQKITRERDYLTACKLVEKGVAEFMDDVDAATYASELAKKEEEAAEEEKEENTTPKPAARKRPGRKPKRK